MKKVVIVCMVLIMVASMSISAFATPGAFVSSPSKNQAPELIGASNASENCSAQIIITAYGNRDQLSAEQRQMLEQAYAEIVGVQDLTALNGQLSAIAEALNISVSDLAVSDLFDISATNCDDHDKHGAFTVTLKAETLKNFVCLLHYYDGEWHIVEEAELIENGEQLQFVEDEFSPFAIVVSTTEIVPEPGSSNVGVIVGVSSGVTLFIGAIVAWYIYNKTKNKGLAK